MDFLETIFGLMWHEDNWGLFQVVFDNMCAPDRVVLIVRRPCPNCDMPIQIGGLNE